jgi:SAM-dependent methyltransferase
LLVEGWDEYARNWRPADYKVMPGHEVKHLGDEWTAEDVRNTHYTTYGLPAEVLNRFSDYLREQLIEPYLYPECAAGMEIGPGGGRITALLLPRTHELHLVDISDAMLQHVRDRFPNHHALRYHVNDGKSLPNLPPDSLDYVFSFDVFVHFESRLIYWYVKQIAELLKPGGVGVIHYSNVTTALGWQQFAGEVEENLHGRISCGNFGVMCPQLMEQFLNSLGLEILASDTGTIPRDAVVVFRKGADWRIEQQYRREGAPDGLPLPPDNLIYLVQGSRYLKAFLDSGKWEAEELRKLFTRHAAPSTKQRAFLDLGCGAGRVIRHLRSWEGVELNGADYNPGQVAWCSANLRHATFVKNELAPPLPFSNERFDFVFANSVFTHLSEPLQFAWIDEIQRILRPGGLLLMTTMGKKMVEDDSPWALKAQSPKDISRFYAGQMIALNENAPEKPDEYLFCVTWHPESYVREKLARGLKVLEFIPASVFGYGLDAYILQKS